MIRWWGGPRLIEFEYPTIGRGCRHSPSTILTVTELVGNGESSPGKITLRHSLRLDLLVHARSPPYTANDEPTVCVTTTRSPSIGSDFD